MRKETGLIKVEVHGQVWFERPGVTEVLFPRLIIHTEINFNDPFIEDSSRVKRDARPPRNE